MLNKKLTAFAHAVYFVSWSRWCACVLAFHVLVICTFMRIIAHCPSFFRSFRLLFLLLLVATHGDGSDLFIHPFILCILHLNTQTIHDNEPKILLVFCVFVMREYKNSSHDDPKNLMSFSAHEICDG